MPVSTAPVTRRLRPDDGRGGDQRRERHRGEQPERADHRLDELDRDEMIVKLLDTGEEKRMRLAQIAGFVRMVLPDDMSRA